MQEQFFGSGRAVTPRLVACDRETRFVAAGLWAGAQWDTPGIMAHHGRPAHDPTARSTDASQFLPKLSLKIGKAERHFLERCLPLPGTLIADDQGGRAASLTSFPLSIQMIHHERLSILYMDDEVTCLDIFKQMFGGDYEVRTALTLAEARRALAEADFDIVFSDYRMPETTGSAFLQEVAASHPDSYRVMLTGALGVGGVLGEISGGIIHLFLKKPWSEDGMRMALELAGASRAWPLCTSTAVRLNSRPGGTRISRIEGDGRR
jgi:CheY-like chemotaxis protein